MTLDQIGRFLLGLSVGIGIFSGYPTALMLKHRRPGAKGSSWLVDERTFMSSEKERYTALGLRFRQMALTIQYVAIVVFLLGVLLIVAG